MKKLKNQKKKAKILENTPKNAQNENPAPTNGGGVFVVRRPSW